MIFLGLGANLGRWFLRVGGKSSWWLFLHIPKATTPNPRPNPHELIFIPNIFLTSKQKILGTNHETSSPRLFSWILGMSLGMRLGRRFRDSHLKLSHWKEICMYNSAPAIMSTVLNSSVGKSVEQEAIGCLHRGFKSHSRSNFFFWKNNFSAHTSQPFHIDIIKK